MAKLFAFKKIAKITEHMLVLMDDRKLDNEDWKLDLTVLAVELRDNIAKDFNAGAAPSSQSVGLDDLHETLKDTLYHVEQKNVLSQDAVAYQLGHTLSVLKNLRIPA